MTYFVRPESSACPHADCEISKGAGFTLLELLVALIVLGALLAGLAQGVNFGLHAWKAQAWIAADRDDLGAVDAVLRRLVVQMEPGTRLTPPQVHGRSDRLALTTDNPASANITSVRRIDAELFVDGNKQLVLRWLPRLHAIWLNSAPVAQEAVLLSGVARAEFAYWQDSPGLGRWVSSWSRQELPGLVRIQLVFLGPNRRHWPEIVAAPARDRPDQ
jgi:general secretion pathway protein J